MSKEKMIDEMTNAIPKDIDRYDMKPKGQHLYIEQRQEIAQTLVNAGYGNIREFADKL